MKVGSAAVLAVALVSLAAGHPGTARADEGDGSGPYTVPASIAADCSVAVDGKLNDWMNGVPDGSTIVFPAHGCYGIDSGLVLADRHDLIVDGGGSTFKTLTLSTPRRVVWRLIGGGNLTLQNMTVRGFNPTAGLHSSYYIGTQSYEWQHAYAFAGVQTGRLENVQAYGVYGDFVEAQADQRPGQPPVSSTNITVHGSRFSGAARHGFGLTSVDGMTIAGNSITNVAQAGVDVEPNAPLPIARNLSITANTFGNIWFSIVSISGIAATNSTGVANVTISQNTMLKPALPILQSCFPSIWVNSALGATTSNYTITNNTLWTISSGVSFKGVNGASVTGNHVSGPLLCRRDVGVEVHAPSSHISVATNIFDARLSMVTYLL